MIYDCKLYLDRDEFCKRKNFVDDEKVRTKMDKSNATKVNISASVKIISGAPNVNFRKISVRKTISDLEFSEHLF